MKYAQDAYGGRIAPTQVSKLWTITPKTINAADMLMKLAASPTPDQILLDLSPKGREFVALRTALAKFYDGSVIDGAVTIPDGPLLKPGKKDERVTLLRQRLGRARARYSGDCWPKPPSTSTTMRRWSRP